MKQAHQDQRDHEESLDSKGKLAMLAFQDRRVKLDLLDHLDLQAEWAMMAILAPQELREGLDPLATLVLQVQLVHQDPLVQQEWV